MPFPSFFISADNELWFIAPYRKIFLSVLCLPVRQSFVSVSVHWGLFLNSDWRRNKQGGNFINKGFQLSAVKSRQIAHREQETRCPFCVPRFLDKSHRSDPISFPLGAQELHLSTPQPLVRTPGVEEQKNPGCQSRHLSPFPAV